jgi:release factor glutamine methyltransferase
VRNILKRTLKRLSTAVARTTVNRYVQKDRDYGFQGLQLKIFAGVFHPGFFFSSKLLVKWLQQQNIKGKKILELGAGAGLISLVAAKHGATVTASDISSTSVKNIRLNANLNQLNVTVVQSDLFDAISHTETFDLIIINPPYYPKDPANDYERAWYCGEDHSYFKKLFSQLKTRNNKEVHYMILADVCDISRIKILAEQNELELQQIYRKKNFWEANFIFRIAPQRLER